MLSLPNNTTILLHFFERMIRLHVIVKALTDQRWQALTFGAAIASHLLVLGMSNYPHRRKIKPQATIMNMPTATL